MNIRLTIAVIVAALLGVALAWLMPDSPWLAGLLTLMKTLFLSALKMIIAPLIFFSLISGVLHLGDAARLRSLGGWTLAYYLTTTALAIAVGLTFVGIWHPWESQPPLENIPQAAPSQLIDAAGSGSALAVLNALVGQMLTNPISALADTNILGIVTNALLIGLATLLLLPADSVVHRFTEAATRIVYKLAEWVVQLMPLGVLAIMYQMAATTDATLIGQLANLMLVVFCATAAHGLLVLPLLAWLLAGIRPGTLLRAVARPCLAAFTTSSSVAALPLSLRTAQERLGVRDSVASFVLPLGATMNMDGTALFEGIAAVFLAYLFGIELTPITTALIFFMAMLGSVGAPGIPSGSMAGMQIVMLAVGIPLEAIALLLLIERPMDTFRTAVNVQGDLVGAVIVEKLLPADVHAPLEATR